jgi:acyl-CoA synthetase (AMP-forming)/AMP-acid ligase II
MTEDSDFGDDDAALAPFRLDRLIRAAAQLSPQSTAVSSGGRDAEALTFMDLERRIGQLARQLRQHCADNDTVVIVGGASTATLVLALAGLSAGLTTVLAGVPLDRARLMEIARQSGASAIIGAGRHGPIDLAQMMVTAAAAAPKVRLVATYGKETHEGAVCLHPRRDDPMLAQSRSLGAKLVTLTKGTTKLSFTHHDQAPLLVAGLDLLGHLPIARGQTIFSLLAPVSFAGLVAGPIASLLAGTRLRLHGPFDAAEFLHQFEPLKNVHLVAPVQAAADLAAAGLVTPDRLKSLILLSRNRQDCRFAPPPDVPVFDFRALGEIAAITNPWPADGAPFPLPSAPRFIRVGRRRILAVEAIAGPPDRLAIRGAAVSGLRSSWQLI